MHKKFILYSDHESLKFFDSQTKKYAIQVRLSNELERYTFVLKHKPGKDNASTDVLSCLPQILDLTSLVVLRLFDDDFAPLWDLHSFPGLSLIVRKVKVL